MINQLVSVLITAYNREKYIKTAIESVLAQTYAHLEIIVLDDCSTDSSYSIAESYSFDARVRIFRNEKNLGQFQTRNKIASLATGKYLKYLDSDDALLPHCLEIMTHMMECYPEAGMLLWSSEGDECYPFELSPKEIYQRSFYFDQPMEHSPLSLLLRKDAFDAIGGFDLNYPLCADMELQYKMARYYPAVFGPRGLVFYRIHEGQVVATTDDSSFRHLVEGFSILIAALRHPECPLSIKERKWQLARQLYGACRRAVKLGIGPGRKAIGIKFLCSIGVSFADVSSLLSKKPNPNKPNLPKAPDSSKFPQYFGAYCEKLSDMPAVSIIIAPDQIDQHFNICLTSILGQRFINFELLVALDDTQNSARQIISDLNDLRIRIVDVPHNTSLYERFRRGICSANGLYCKFIGHYLPILYPYALEIEVAILEHRPNYNVLCAGSAGLSLGGLALSPMDAISLDLATDGKYLRVDPSCVLIRRSALTDNTFDDDMGTWSFIDLLYKLSATSGAILGPCGLSTAWRRHEVKPDHAVTDEIKQKCVSYCRAAWVGADDISWEKLLILGLDKLQHVSDKCFWDNKDWILSDMISCRMD